MGVSLILKYVRVIVSVAAFAMLTALFADFGMEIPSVAAWLAKVQLLPAAMAFSLTTFVIWLLLTLIFGRIYCSSVCPLGVFQDFFARLPRLGRVSPGWHYHYSPPLTRLRQISLFIVVISILLGVSAVYSLLDPYSIYGRFCLNIVRPLWAWILNLWTVVDGAPQMRIAFASVLGLVISMVTMTVIAVIAFRNGRTFCNTVCPVGTTLSFISRYSVFRIDINTDRCIQCRNCEHRCKASCIDLTSHVVDTSRCVVCFDCLTDCPNDAISYTYTRHQLSIPLMMKAKGTVAGPAAGITDGSVRMLDRRRFLSAGLVAAAVPVVTKAASAVGKVEDLTVSRAHKGLLPVTPPGVRTRREFLDRCTSCGLCVDRCPQKVIKASLDEYGLLRAMHPVMDYDASWCEYNCTLCTNLCPTSALHPLTVAEKHRSRNGLARVDRSACISYADGVKCGACSRRCPSGAITMTDPSDGSGPFPVVDSDKCIGCGACQYVCPVEGKAIRVGGIA